MEAIDHELTSEDARVEDLLATPRQLTALERLQLLDTSADDHFDRITRLAARLLCAQVCTISLVDGTRQFAKSAAGFRQGTSMLLDGSICQHPVASRRPLDEPGRLFGVDVHAQLDLQAVLPDAGAHRLVHRCVVELVGNACRHSSSRVGQVSASVHEDEVRLAVIDSGAGWQGTPPPGGGLSLLAQDLHAAACASPHGTPRPASPSRPGSQRRSSRRLDRHELLRGAG